MLSEYNEKIIEWAKDREIDKKGTIEGQAIKTIEEMSELVKGICKDDIDLIKDSIGDVYVTLVIGCMLNNTNLSDVLDLASKELESDGITEEDLKTYCGTSKENLLSSLTFEMNSFLDRLSYNHYGLSELYKVLLCISRVYETTVSECVELAYKEISDQKGEMVNGIFVKEEDLKK